MAQLIFHTRNIMDMDNFSLYYTKTLWFPLLPPPSPTLPIQNLKKKFVGHSWKTELLSIVGVWMSDLFYQLLRKDSVYNYSKLNSVLIELPPPPYLLSLIKLSHKENKYHVTWRDFLCNMFVYISVGRYIVVDSVINKYIIHQCNAEIQVKYSSQHA